MLFFVVLKVVESCAFGTEKSKTTNKYKIFQVQTSELEKTIQVLAYRECVFKSIERSEGSCIGFADFFVF